MKRLNITDSVLDRIGFSEYWDENGTWGGRTLTFSNGTRFRIIEQEETECNELGEYVAKHFYFADWFAIPKENKGSFDLFFLHEMYECIEFYYPDCVEEFVSKCRKLNMSVYLDEWINREAPCTACQGEGCPLCQGNLQESTCTDKQHNTYRAYEPYNFCPDCGTEL